MQITVKLYLTFRLGRFANQVLACPPDATASHLAQRLGIPDTEIGLILINTHQAELEQHLVEGDTIALFPIVGGG
ncbi:MAG: MoaD/ThiS family protein [Acidobacteriota bacterium]